MAKPEYIDRKAFLDYMKGTSRYFNVKFDIIYVFIPPRETLIEMQIARFTTVENAEWALDAIKSATDYIVSAIKELG